MSIFEYDNFKNDPYGWLTNQAGHALLGVVLYTLAVAAMFWSFDEFPQRHIAWAVVAGIYITWEFVIQRGAHFWDSVEDTIFTVGYGAGTVALAFREVTPGLPKFQACIYDVIPMVAFFAFHVLIGVALRWRGLKSE
jgi:hypothetical protein